MSNKPKTMASNAPHVAIGATVVLVVVGVAAALIADDRASLTALLALVVTTVPALVAAAYAERASRDIRNGTVTQKAREGTTKALEDTGVAQRAMVMETLSELLQRNLNEPPPPVVNVVPGHEDADELADRVAAALERRARKRARGDSS